MSKIKDYFSNKSIHNITIAVMVDTETGDRLLEVLENGKPVECLNKIGISKEMFFKVLAELEEYEKNKGALDILTILEIIGFTTINRNF